MSRKNLSPRIFARMPRNQFLAAGIALGAAATAIAAASPGVGTSIHQEVEFEASPVASARAERIYEALLDDKQFSELSGASARIHREAGGTFDLFGGRITGRNIELVPNQRIVQAWRLQTWPAGVYSIVRFELTPTESGTRLVFDHTGFPLGEREALSANWTKKYWAPLRTYLYLDYD